MPGYLLGRQLMPREVVAEILWHWTDLHYQAKALATALAESRGYLGAYHDNLDADGNVTSRDCGVFQINIPADKIGSPLEDSLRTESHDPDVWLPVLRNNAASARALFDEPWNRNGLKQRRLFEAWVAYTTGWATFPEWWVWHQDADGNPVGPWIETGRYAQQAIVGLANVHLVMLGDRGPDSSVTLAQQLQTYFGVKGEIGIIRKGGMDIVGWAQVPPKPSAPPKDGVGPRPEPNSGT